MDAHKKVALKDGCAQAIVALLYNERDEKYGWAKSCASVQCSQWARWMKKCCANVPWIKHGSTLCTAVHCTYCW